MSYPSEPMNLVSRYSLSIAELKCTLILVMKQICTLRDPQARGTRLPLFNAHHDGLPLARIIPILGYIVRVLH